MPSPERMELSKTLPEREPKKVTSPYSKLTVSYLAEAKNQEGVEKQKTLLLAAGRLISDGQWRQGAAILSHTSDVTPSLTAEKDILLAQIELFREQPKIVVDKLAGINAKDLTHYHQIQLHELLAKAYRAQNKTLESVNERIKLESLLTGEEKQDNRRTIWLTLAHLSQGELESLSAQVAKQSDLQGWLQLVLISRKYQENNSKSLLAALNQWQDRFSNHSARYILPQPLDSMAYKMHAPPKKIALLLPLSGALQGPGVAVRDGFMAGYKNNNNEVFMGIKIYDTNQENVISLYQKAITEGAEYVVGPLTKSEVTAVAALPNPVPTLFLNDTDTSTKENSYIFGLSPIHEATQVAIRAKNKGYKHALVIAPGNNWGNEVTKAFTQQWEKDDGRITDSYFYNENDNLTDKLKEFLGITHSQEREKQLKELLGQKIETVINRRQDFDIIFLLAYPSKARQIMPLLNYYYAKDVPIYATSSVYSGSANPLKDKDLDGIIFCDIPWVFSHQVGTRNWPEQFNSYNRLFALGMESYNLATQLNHLILFPAAGSKNGEGILYLKPIQHIARILEWGQFKQGLVHSLGEAA